MRTPSALIIKKPATTPDRPSNWARSLHRALASVGQQPLRIYDCRRAAATTWLRAGTPLAETARRLGHSVETLVSTYIGALHDEEHIAKQRIDVYLRSERPTENPPDPSHRVIAERRTVMTIGRFDRDQVDQ